MCVVVVRFLLSLQDSKSRYVVFLDPYHRQTFKPNSLLKVCRPPLPSTRTSIRRRTSKAVPLLLISSDNNADEEGDRAGGGGEPAELVPIPGEFPTKSRRSVSWYVKKFHFKIINTLFNSRPFVVVPFRRGRPTYKNIVVEEEDYVYATPI